MQRAWGLAAALVAGIVTGAGVAVRMQPAEPASRPAAAPLESVSAADRPVVVAPAGARDVLLIIACTTRKDQVSVYAPELRTTPFLERLAAEGVVLDDLITAAPWTKVAATAILTGRHAVEIGMVEPSDRRNERVLPSEVVTLAEAFHEVGYRTVGLTTNPNLQSDYGFEVGFEVYLQPARRWKGERAPKIRGEVAVRSLLDALDALDGEGPRFVQAVLIDAHKPFFDGAAFRAPGVPDEVADYRASLRALDGVVEGLVRGARERLGGDLVVVVVNDHGEGLSSPPHHGQGHGRYLYDSVVGGVGIFVAPGLPSGGRVGGLVSQVDLAPTLWGLAGLDDGPAWSGFDVGPALRGEQAPIRDAAYVDTWFHGADRAAVYRTGRFCQWEFRPDADGKGPAFPNGCFDRSADPRAERPYTDEAELAALRAWREAAVARSGDVQAVIPDPGVGEQLEALGYQE